MTFFGSRLLVYVLLTVGKIIGFDGLITWATAFSDGPLKDFVLLGETGRTSSVLISVPGLTGREGLSDIKSLALEKSPF